MKVSVIIPNYNYASFLKHTLDSVFSQSYNNIECIVVNDGSTDNSIEVLETLRKNRFPSLIIINKENGGLSSARNTGIKHANGDLIAFLDADDCWTSNKIANQVKEIFKTNADIVFSNYQYYDGFKYSNHSEKIIEEPTIMDFVAKNPILASSSSIILRKEVIQKVGYFDPNLRSLEDLDYWFRCALEGYRFSFCNHKDVFLRIHSQGNMSSNYMRMLSYHLIVLESQVMALKDKKLIEKNEHLFKKAIIERLGTIRWYAIQLKKYEYSLLTIFVGIRLNGVKYLFSVLIIKRIFSDFFGLLIKKGQPAVNE